MEHPGTKITHPIIYQFTGQSGGFVGDGPLPTTSQENLTAGEWDMVSYQVPLIVSIRDLMSNSGPRGVHRLLNARRKVAELDIMNKMGGDVFTGNQSASEPDKFDGLELAVDDDDSPKNYGGIATTDFADWKAADKASVGAISLFILKGHIGDVTRGSDQPDLGLVTQDIQDKLWDLMQADQRFVDEKPLWDAGPKAIKVHGVPLLVDPNVPSASGTSQTYYLLNSKYWYYYVHPEVNMAFTGLERPLNAWNLTGHIIHMGQILCDNRRAQLRASGVNPS